MSIKDYDTVQLGEMFAWLDDLRDSGAINMVAARQPLAEEFGLDKIESREIWAAWMTTYDSNISAPDRACEALEAAGASP